MDSVKRVYVEKKPEYAVKETELKEEISGFLGIKGVKEVKVLITYDVENLSEEVFNKALTTVFSEPPVDNYYLDEVSFPENAKVFCVQYLPGQFDQRADSAVQCVKFLKEDEEPVIRTSITYAVIGDVSDEEFGRIKSYCINPVDSKEIDMVKPDTLITEYDDPADVIIFDGFVDMKEEELSDLYKSL